MIKHIGIVACSAEGAALCYRTICAEAVPLLGEHKHPEITLHSHSLSDYVDPITRGDWERVGGLMLSSAHKVALSGAKFVICPDNTIHQAFNFVERRSPIPWLHIAREVAQVAQTNNFKRLGILGTQFLMEGPVYSEVCREYGLETVIPERRDRERIHEIILTELVKGIFLDLSREYFNELIGRLKGAGCDAVVLGCTEIPLIVNPDRARLPTLDSTRLLARAALREALAKTETVGT